jgi:sugar lactone lactonase YvrE
MKKRRQTKLIGMVCFVATMMFLWTCEDNDKFVREPYDPLKPVEIDGFKPDSGGFATKLIISGSNFGSDLSKIKVYFTGTDGQTSLTQRAPVIGSDGRRLYALTPRLSHMRKCTISVVVEGDSVALEEKDFLYRTLTTVTTIAGKKGTSQFRGGTLSEAEFISPSTLCVDAEGNIFMSHWAHGEPSTNNHRYGFVLINQEKDLVEILFSGTSTGAPTADADGRVIMAPFDCGDNFLSFDPATQWAPKQRLMLHPTKEMLDGGMQDFNITNGNCRLGMWASALDDGYIYTHYNNGQLIKFHPVSRIGQLVTSLTSSGSFTYIDPYKTNIMYLIFQNNHVIYTYDLITGEYERFAGISGRAGWVDGERLNAEFNMPSQMVVDKDGSIYVADRMNHCIRKITPDGMVTTIIGKGGVAGYQDGNPEDALFDNPRGVAIDDDGTIYIADYGNNCVRKLAIE